jgi:hypothetical protein
MDAKTKELAEQAGFYSCGRYSDDFENEVMQSFSELIRADERDKCSEDYLNDCVKAVEQAVLKEREACAKLCEEENWSYAMGNIIRSERGVA